MPKAATTTGHPIDDALPTDPMALLSLLAGRAMEAGADPSSIVSPDHELLMLWTV
jgi:hypothetical protein